MIPGSRSAKQHDSRITSLLSKVAPSVTSFWRRIQSITHGIKGHDKQRTAASLQLDFVEVFERELLLWRRCVLAVPCIDHHNLCKTLPLHRRHALQPLRMQAASVKQYSPKATLGHARTAK